MKNISRRQFLTYVGAVGGTSALLKTSIAMGLMKEDPFKGPVKVTPAPIKNKPSVLILGSGIAGLATAFELEQAGYDCTILEASFRAGGRNLTVRNGDKIDEMGHTQICNFDKQDNLFFNCGPARIPGHHKRTLHYCKALNVPLQIKANSSKMAYFQDDKFLGGKPKRIIEYHTDARGLMSELLWKSADSNTFNQMLNAEDVEKLMDFSKAFGDLTENGKYIGSERAGSITDRMLDYPQPHAPMELKALLDSRFWYGGLLGAELYDWCEPLMEPIGGMDAVVKGFLRHLKKPPVLNAQVKKIFNKANGVEVTYEQGGEFHTVTADYCFNNIPAYFMAGIENNFSSTYQAGLNSVKRGHLFKIAYQMKSRFWEDDGIYGGISYSADAISQIWYPSHDINAQKGILLGAYTWDPKHSAMFESLTPLERLKVGAMSGEKIHPGYSKYIENGISIPWARMNHQMGCGMRMNKDDFKTYFHLLQKPEGRHFMIGDQISHHSGWQEGALASSEQALGQFNHLVATNRT
ncbi:FAD-dependent oxidoreductase [Pseudoalteromonas sp. MMG010]|uniref:flavin monoamine oxidase family protein n=1 Tax=Pseudoalteromonas sp. MMG010 TaxID=2822685 RepID=UPI001B3A2DB8|nr:FAD-dependent oxidoreductase [Pseudoalteromonas sp. MMG010]MBQ4832976.1 FAD-dependent oxidoreductase [Pseudoalteromonas sp. MMG010]